jgi:hypothetical protein
MCTYCANVYHPKCAGLSAISKRVSGDWACPECVWVAETGLEMDPIHLPPSVNTHGPTGHGATEVHMVESEIQEDNEEEPLVH